MKVVKVEILGVGRFLEAEIRVTEIAATVAAASHEHDAGMLEGVWWAPFGAASHVVVV